MKDKKVRIILTELSMSMKSATRLLRMKYRILRKNLTDGRNVRPQKTCGEFKSEIAHRDSLMAVADSSCSVEKDSLRAALNSEQAKTKNWEQSYETMKKNNETCARALSVSIEANEKSKEKEIQSKS